jgi:hypothetical protein
LQRSVGTDRIGVTGDMGDSGHCMATLGDLQCALDHVCGIEAGLGDLDVGGCYTIQSEGIRTTRSERIFELRARTNRLPLTEEEKDAVSAAVLQRDRLAAKLRSDSAFENPLESILENPIFIPDHMASAVQIALQKEQGAPMEVQCHEVMDRLSDH